MHREGSFRIGSSEQALGPGKPSQKGWAFPEEKIGLEGERKWKKENPDNRENHKGKEAGIWALLEFSRLLPLEFLPPSPPLGIQLLDFSGNFFSRSFVGSCSLLNRAG
jgi:hypothetical protein